MNRVVICCTAMLALTVAAARAETIVVRPDPCPRSADQPLIIDLGDVETFTDDPAKMLGRVLIIYPPMRDGWASARILMRFDLNWPDPAPDDEPCSPARNFRIPR